LAPHALGGRIGRDKLRILGLQLLKPAHQFVKLEVGDFRVIQDVVPILVVADIISELFNFFFDGFGHAILRKCAGAQRLRPAI
jgi:hypothetical protein